MGKVTLVSFMYNKEKEKHMNRYQYVLEGKNFQKMTFQEVEDLKAFHGSRNSPKGISYSKNNPNTVLLSSNSQHDILDCIEKQSLWEHSSKPVRVKPGDTVYVVPNAELQNKFGSAAVGVKFTLTKSAYKSKKNKIKWTSDLKINNKS